MQRVCKASESTLKVHMTLYHVCFAVRSLRACLGSATNLPTYSGQTATYLHSCLSLKKASPLRESSVRCLLCCCIQICNEIGRIPHEILLYSPVLGSRLDRGSRGRKIHVSLCESAVPKVSNAFGLMQSPVTFTQVQDHDASNALETIDSDGLYAPPRYVHL